MWFEENRKVIHHLCIILLPVCLLSNFRLVLRFYIIVHHLCIWICYLETINHLEIYMKTLINFLQFITNNSMLECYAHVYNTGVLPFKVQLTAFHKTLCLLERLYIFFCIICVHIENDNNYSVDSCFNHFIIIDAITHDFLYFYTCRVFCMYVFISCNAVCLSFCFFSFC